MSTYTKVQPPKCPVCGATTRYTNKNCYYCPVDGIEMSFDLRKKRQLPAVNIYGLDSDGKRMLLEEGVLIGRGIQNLQGNETQNSPKTGRK